MFDTITLERTHPSRDIMNMVTRDDVKLALAPILAAVSRIDPADPEAAATLARMLPVDSQPLRALAALVRTGVAARTLATRETKNADGSVVRFERIVKPAHDDDLSVDLVHMTSPGPGHTHPRGEIDLCFVVDGAPLFDGRPAGWTVYPPGSWHVPTVAHGAMDILYFLPGGALVFGDKPAS